MKYASYEKFIEAQPEDMQPIFGMGYIRPTMEHLFNKLNDKEWPQVVDVAELMETSDKSIATQLKRWMRWMGYEKYVNQESKDGRWRFGGRATTLYKRTPASS